MDNNYQNNPYQQNAQPAQPGYQQQTAYQQPYQQAAYQQPYQMPESKFDGSVLDCFIYCLATSAIISFTFGIATPWAICLLYKFILSHVTVDGRRLTFDGTGGQLFGNWIKWLLLTVITFGIYSFWVMPKMLNWVAKHTHFAA